jgi:hypothetical protein
VLRKTAKLPLHTGARDLSSRHALEQESLLCRVCLIEIIGIILQQPNRVESGTGGCVKHFYRAASLRSAAENGIRRVHCGVQLISPLRQPGHLNRCIHPHSHFSTAKFSSTFTRFKPLTLRIPLQTSYCRCSPPCARSRSMRQRSEATCGTCSMCLSDLNWRKCVNLNW